MIELQLNLLRTAAREVIDKDVSCWFPQSLKRESSTYPQRREKASDMSGVGH